MQKFRFPLSSSTWNENECQPIEKDFIEAPKGDIEVNESRLPPHIVKCPTLDIALL